MTSFYTITESDNLLRRIPKRPPYMNDGEISSAAFKPSKKDTDTGLSVDIENLTTYSKSVLDITIYDLYKISAQVPLSNGLGCKHDPLPDNNAHALITGKINDSKSRLLKKYAEKVYIK